MGEPGGVVMGKPFAEETRRDIRTAEEWDRFIVHASTPGAFPFFNTNSDRGRVGVTYFTLPPQAPMQTCVRIPIAFQDHMLGKKVSDG